MDRRTFLELMGAAGASTLVAGCSDAPLERLYAYLTPPQDIVPGVAVYYATVCRACPAGCGIVVKTREARPIKLEGNPAHPVNRGALCARGQAFIQGLYSANRVREPLLRQGGKLVPVSWEKALAAVADTLKDARSVGLLTGLESGSFEDLVSDLRSGLPALESAAFELLSLGALRRASGLLLGERDAEVPVISLEPADHVVSLGADFLDAWVSPVAFAREWAEGHGYGPAGRRLQVDYFGPRRNLTATAADRFRCVSVEEIGAIALVLLREVLKARGNSTTVSPRAVPLAERLGASRAPAHPAAEAAAKRLLTARRGLILYGGAEVATPEATAIHATVLLANFLLGAVGESEATPLRYGEGYALSKVSPVERTLDLVNRAGSGQLDVLLVHGANPAYHLPGGFDAATQLARAKRVVALAAEHDETTAQAHVVLPVHHPLESFGDYEITRRVVGLMQPVRSPLHDSRHVGDVLLDLWRRIGRRPRFGEYKRYIVARHAQGGASSLEDLLTKGVYVRPKPEFPLKGSMPPPPVSLPKDDRNRLPVVAGATAATKGDLTLLVPASASFFDGRDAHRDFLLETPDSLTQGTWEVPVEISEDVASAAGITTGDRVRLEAAVTGRALEATAFVGEELAPRTVALRLGGGRRFAKEPASSGSVLSLLGVALDPVSRDLSLTQGRVTLRRLGPGTFASVSGGTDTEERLLCLAMGEADARSGRYPIMTRHGEVKPGAAAKAHPKAPAGEERRPEGAPLPTPEQELVPGRPADNVHELMRFPEHRFGLVVDLDRCTGCGACVVACYAENNIAVVGRDQVLKGRELSWLRIEKHTAREGRVRQVRFLPVMCQHCAQAPCETVCPVFAAYHTPDGLNAQIYNRCIGTRYCANNCPYKVRRFNYFDWPREKLQTEQLNPDVTVRSRGVMEKCTLCIQRIREATNRAKADGRRLRDGEIQTACAQTCPTGAIVFGDFKQPEWAMTKRSRDPRAYRLLDYAVNTRPSVVYLRRVDSEPAGRKS